MIVAREEVKRCWERAGQDSGAQDSRLEERKTYPLETKGEERR